MTSIVCDKNCLNANERFLSAIMMAIFLIIRFIVAICNF
jgi:hypothetical protein